MLCMCSKRALRRPSQAVGSPGTTAPVPWSPQVGLPWFLCPGCGNRDVAKSQLQCTWDTVCDMSKDYPAPEWLRSNFEVTSLLLKQQDIIRGLQILPLLAPISMKTGKEVRRRSLNRDAEVNCTWP